MKLVIVVHHRFELWTAPPWLTERLRRDFPQLEVVQRNSYDGIEQDLSGAEIAITWSLRPEQLRAAPKLRWIHSPAAAVHQLLIPEIVASDVLITNARSVHGPVVAEHVIAVILAMAKLLPSALRWQARRVWAQEQLWQERPRPREIAGATLGLIGLGSIGREVARRADALGMRILAVREHPQKGIDWPVAPATDSGALAHTVFGPDELDSVLAQADYVVIAAPLTAKTRTLLDAARLARMKPGACLVNVSRGALVDERALAEALGSGRIAGAALDVFEREPLPPDSPLWDLENLLITPHSAALTDKLWERHYALIAQNLRRYLAGEPLLSLVNKQKGY